MIIANSTMRNCLLFMSAGRIFVRRGCKNEPHREGFCSWKDFFFDENIRLTFLHKNIIKAKRHFHLKKVKESTECVPAASHIEQSQREGYAI